MKNLKFSLALVLTFIANLLMANTFYGIIVADVEDPNIGNACESDAAKMLKEFKELAEHNGLDLFVREFKREQFSKNEVAKYVEKIKAKSDDVIFFYYSGHGIYEEGIGKVLKLKNEHLELKEVKNNLEEKKARLKFVVTDCCSLVVPLSMPQNEPLIAHSLTERGAESRPLGVVIRAKNYRRLLAYDGILVVESSQPGQFSYANREGGIFTKALLETIHYSVENTNSTTWKSILDKTREKVEETVGKIDKNQVPVCDDTNLYMLVNQGTTTENIFNAIMNNVQVQGN